MWSALDIWQRLVSHQMPPHILLEALREPNLVPCTPGLGTALTRIQCPLTLCLRQCSTLALCASSTMLSRPKPNPLVPHIVPSPPTSLPLYSVHQALERE